ncbi:MAG TPA: DUF1573 domain-containing protein [Bacteroidales bacterium]|nr:DUF1573 domain-containing protein [Bacteroidales bacterium]
MKRTRLFTLLIAGIITISNFSNFTSAQNSNPATLYPQAMGNLRFKTNYIVFPTIYNTEVKKDTVVFYNNWNKTMNLKLENIPQYIKCDLKQKELKPGQTGNIIIEYDASKVNDFGFVMGRFNIITNDTIDPNKIISIGANIVEDFSKLTPEQKANAPKIVFKNTKHNFGTIKEGEIVKYNYEFTNEGKSELIIRKTKASCGCTAISPNKTNLKPGESSQVGIEFNSKGRTGKQIKNVTVITNDPENPTIILTFEVQVEPKQNN